MTTVRHVTEAALAVALDGVAGGTTAVQSLDLATGDGSVAVPATFALLSATFPSASRLRVYRTAAGRDADAARDSATAYPGGLGLLYEYLATAAGTTEHEGLILTRDAAETVAYYRADTTVTVAIKEL